MVEGSYLTNHMPMVIQGVPKKIGPSIWLVITLKIIIETDNLRQHFKG